MKKTARPAPTKPAAHVLALAALALLVALGQAHAARAQWTQPAGSSNVYKTDAGGNVGIGTSAPAEKLHVPARVRFGNMLFGESRPGGVEPSGEVVESFGHLVLMSAAGYDIKLGSAGLLPRVVINSAGNVGVGTASPAYRLDVQGGQVNASGGLCIAGVCKASWSEVGGGSGGTQWTTSASNIYYSSGSVGIGTDAPGSNLHVHQASGNATIRVSGSGSGGLNSGYVAIAGDGGMLGYFGGSGPIQGANNDIAVRSESGKAIVLLTGGNNERVRVTPGGNVGVGTAAPIRGLQVSGANWTAGAELALANTGMPAAYRNFNFFGDATTGAAGRWYVRALNDAGTASGRDFLAFDNATGNVGVGTFTPGHRLDVAGQVNSSGGLCIAGDCKTSWAQVGGGTPSQWTTSGANISYGAGNVGIGAGMSTPVEALTVNGKIAVNRGPSPGPAEFRIYNGGSVAEWAFRQAGSASHNLSISKAVSGAYSDYLTIDTSGKVGIGKADPTEALDVVGNISATGNISAKYQDVAEWVPTTQKLQAGTVVVLDPARSNHVLASGSAYDTSVAGVVSAQPGIILGEGGEGKVMVATTGRVRVRVDATRGPIKIGDLLVTSGVAGVAMRSEPMVVGGRPIHAPGTIIGKALEPLANGVGEILVLLSMQ